MTPAAVVRRPPQPRSAVAPGRFGPVTVFFAVVFGLRLLHAWGSTGYHICGDMGLPWLMANDWNHSPQTRFFWGQNYLGTYETAVLAGIGHLIFGAGGTIPTWFGVFFGQLLATAGATFFFAGLRGIRPGFGERRVEFGAAIVLLGFAAPSLQKYSFGVGSGYSLTPLVTGLVVWLWARRPGLGSFFLGGILIGLAQSVLRLNLVPALALSGCLTVGFAIRFLGERLRPPAGDGGAPDALDRRAVPSEGEGEEAAAGLRIRRRRGDRRSGWPGLAFLAGLVLGALPELRLGLEREGPASIMLYPLWARWRNGVTALAQTGVATGLLPYTATTPEDALWFRGHDVFAHDLLDLLSIAVLGALLWIRRSDLKDRRMWILWTIFGVDLVLIIFSGAPIDLYSARRYGFPLLLALSGVLCLTLDTWLGKALTAARAVGLIVYLLSSLSYESPLFDVQKALVSADYDPMRDCLSGGGGDLSALMALTSQPATIVPLNWRLLGNYSKALDPRAPRQVAIHCRHIFHLNTGETPIAAARPYCRNEKSLYEEPPPILRPPVTLAECGK